MNPCAPARYRVVKQFTRPQAVKCLGAKSGSASPENDKRENQFIPVKVKISHAASRLRCKDRHAALFTNTAIKKQQDRPKWLRPAAFTANLLCFHRRGCPLLFYHLMKVSKFHNKVEKGKKDKRRKKDRKLIGILPHETEIAA